MRLRIKALFASFRHQGQLIELSSILLTSFQIAPQQRLYHHTNNNTILPPVLTSKTFSSHFLIKVANNTDLGSLIWIFDCRFSIRCGNLAIIQPFWFYVKSILADFRQSKTVILTILKALNFVFWKYFTLENVKKYLKLKFQSRSNGQKAVLGLQNHKNWFYVKSERQKILKFPHFVIPN